MDLSADPVLSLDPVLKLCPPLSPPPARQVSTAPVNVFIEDYFGFKHSFIGWAVLISIAFVVFFRLVALFAVTKINHQSR